MSRYSLEYSRDNGITWVRQERTELKNRAMATHVMNEIENESNSNFDWRVGFLLRLRTGIVYRVVITKTGKQLI